MSLIITYKFNNFLEEAELEIEGRSLPILSTDKFTCENFQR